MQTFLKPFKKLAGRVLLGLKPLALRARSFKPNKYHLQSTGQCPNFFMMFTFQNVMLCQSQRHVIAAECTRLHPVLTCFEQF